MGVTLKTRVREGCNSRKHPQVFMKLLDRLRGIGGGQEEGYESRTIMVLANGMYSKLREELEDDRMLLFGYIFMAYCRHWK